VSNDVWLRCRIGGITQAGSQGAILGTFLGFTLLNARISLNGQMTQLGSWTLLFVVYGAISLAAFCLTLRSLPETRPTPEAGRRRPSAGRKHGCSCCW
jgi:MFS family permease